MKSKREIRNIIKKIKNKLNELDNTNNKKQENILKSISYYIRRIEKIMIQDRCKHLPEEIDDCCLKYTRCKKCHKTLSEIISKSAL